jgi:hypothetical protein
MARLRMERVSWTERALWAAFLAVAVAPLALQPPPEEVARLYVDAINRGDVEAALGLTTTDVVIRPALGGYDYRREEAREVLEWRAALHERWRVDTWALDAEEGEVRIGFELENDAWRLLAPPPRLEVVLDVRAGRLASESIRAGAEVLREPLVPFLVWARARRPLELEKAWRNDRPVRGADAASQLLELLREWRATAETLAASAAVPQP